MTLKPRKTQNTKAGNHVTAGFSGAPTVARLLSLFACRDRHFSLKIWYYSNRLESCKICCTTSESDHTKLALLALADNPGLI